MMTCSILRLTQLKGTPLGFNLWKLHRHSFSLIQRFNWACFTVSHILGRLKLRNWVDRFKFMLHIIVSTYIFEPRKLRLLNDFILLSQACSTIVVALFWIHSVSLLNIKQVLSWLFCHLVPDFYDTDVEIRSLCFGEFGLAGLFAYDFFQRKLLFSSCFWLLLRHLKFSVCGQVWIEVVVFHKGVVSFAPDISHRELWAATTNSGQLTSLFHTDVLVDAVFMLVNWILVV